MEKDSPTIDRRAMIKRAGTTMAVVSALTGRVGAEGSIPNCPEKSENRIPDSDYQPANNSHNASIDWAVETGTCLSIYGPEPVVNYYQDDKWRYQCEISSTSQAYTQSDEDDKIGAIEIKDIEFGITENEGSVYLEFDDNDDYRAGWENGSRYENSDAALTMTEEVVGLGLEAMSVALRWGTPTGIAAGLLTSFVFNVAQNISTAPGDENARVEYDFPSSAEASGNIYFQVQLDPGQQEEITVIDETHVQYDGQTTDNYQPLTYISETITAPEEAPSNCD